MKYQLIMLPQPILVSDEEIKENDFYYSSQGILQSKKSYFEDSRGLKTYHLTHELWSFPCQKIIAGIPELPSIDFSGLTEEEYKRIGWIDVLELSQKTYPQSTSILISDVIKIHNNKQNARAIAFVRGFKTAQSLNDKKFSLEDLKLAILRGYKLGKNGGSEIDRKQEEKYLESYLSQPKVFNVEILEITEESQLTGVWYTNPKITNNSIKITEVL